MAGSGSRRRRRGMKGLGGPLKLLQKGLRLVRGSGSPQAGHSKPCMARGLCRCLRCSCPAPPGPQAGAPFHGRHRWV